MIKGTTRMKLKLGFMSHAKERGLVLTRGASCHQRAVSNKRLTRRTCALADKPEAAGVDATATKDDDASEMLSIFGMEKAADITFQLKFCWGKDTLAFAVDQTLGKHVSSPLTEYFFWPQDDAWENLKAVLESKDWIPASEKISMLNRVTEVINFWTPAEGEEQKSTDEAKAKFQDCKFVGTFY
mmetsp:Transcript_7936/g.14835  ORF Transcript_7936/g.14835 Transcript_7936/m.14835 type:complete len:184 (+) Transcript_7936:104-655(+)|eukprot:CAMPEP_0197473008 /NCGR_PEP_ID=MMETSP1309-20131121/4287_1 /TAXON_ID=464262 /ORGANISM="Genus nov. species nov., Strain RCC998" /LENGTH=183 /DNA_ID=CAMNT_0043011899 /DNA_START=180 /DNA_END=731 /DNA_ORIENTATION=+